MCGGHGVMVDHNLREHLYRAPQSPVWGSDLLDFSSRKSPMVAGALGERFRESSKDFCTFHFINSPLNLGKNPIKSHCP